MHCWQWPSPSPDGRYVYFNSSNFSGDNRQIRRIELGTGRIEDLTESNDAFPSCCGRPAYPLRLGAAAPEVSPDGRWITFARKLPGASSSYRGKQYMGRTALWIRDMKTGAERLAMDPIEPMVASGSKTLEGCATGCFNTRS